MQEYLHDIAVNQLRAEYQSKGYTVAIDAPIGDTKADLVAKRADEVVVLEIKVGSMTPEKRERVTKLGDYVRDHKNYKFLVVVSTPPKPKNIDVPDLDELLHEYILDNFPSELDSLSSHTQIEDVIESTVDELSVLDEGRLAVKGSGVVEVELHYGSKDDEHISYDSFPFTFDAVLKRNEKDELTIDDMHELTVDTSSWDES
ncbi:hypothetical protein J2I47_06500 [Fibrella sp. HMF5335]|uniref:REase AHJR-like domain-containing protein n=1 Tax=Fibrella rubiginis TaxID=2817060 RepID=A0A939K4H5_9BACT|nr:hypothetical protein [Fibrella rubiginis]MBO0936191.1 hypothetical protein [Fibrella rubiginis]